VLRGRFVDVQADDSCTVFGRACGYGGADT